MKEYLILQKNIDMLCEPNSIFTRGVYSVYQTINKKNGMIYVGVHYSNKDNDKYAGSGTLIQEAIKNEGKENFITEVLFEYDNEVDMLAKEAEIVNEKFIARPDTYNVTLGGGGYNMLHCICVKDKNGNKFSVHKTDPRYLSGELVGHSKGTIVVKDKENKIYNINLDDPRYLSGELISINKNKILVKDKDNNLFQVSITDSRYLSSELVYMATGKTTVKDINGNIFQVDKTDSRIKSGELVGIMKGTITVKDLNGNTLSISKNDSRYLSGELIAIAKGKINVYNSKIKQNKLINKEELEKYLKEGWIRGKKIEYSRVKTKNNNNYNG